MDVQWVMHIECTQWIWHSSGDATTPEGERRDQQSHKQTHKNVRCLHVPPLRLRNSRLLIEVFSLCFFLAASWKLAAQWLTDKTWDQNKATDISRNTHMKSTMWRFAFVYFHFMRGRKSFKFSDRQRRRRPIKTSHTCEWCVLNIMCK